MTSSYRIVEAQRIEDYCPGPPSTVANSAQLSRGPFYGRTEELFHREIGIVRRYASQTLYESGYMPAGRIGFSLHSMPVPFYTGGVQYETGDISSVGSASPYTIISLGACRYCSISADLDFLATHASTEATERLQSMFVGGEPIRLRFDPDACELFGLMQHIFDNVASGDQRFIEETTAAPMRARLAKLLGDLLATAPIVKQRVNARANIFGRALDFIVRSDGKPLTVDEVASAVGTSRRNLEVSFTSFLRLSPKEFINHMRLNRVRHALCADANAPISEVAGRFGYVHMSHFSRAYYTLFNELPSVTVQRITDMTTSEAI